MNRKQRRSMQTSGQPSVAPVSPIELIFERAKQAQRSGDLEAAKQLYQQILAIDAAHADSQYFLGVIAMETGNDMEAIQLFNKAIKLKNNEPLYYCNLGNVFRKLKKNDEASVCYKVAISLNPHLAKTYYDLGLVLKIMGRNDEAVAQFQHYLKRDAADSFGAQLLLAELVGGALPQRTPDAQIQHLYQLRADGWDRGSYFADSYRGHKLVVDAVNKMHLDAAPLDILDIGCGTGLVGQLLRSRAKTLEGVDLSAAMLAKAKEKGIYDALHEADLVSFLSQKTAAYDAITCAATLIHFGDLQPVFRAAANALKNNGSFTFTAFPNDKEGVSPAHLAFLAQGGCYAHGADYIKRVAAENNFTMEILDTQVHEYYEGEAVHALIVGLRRNECKHLPN